MRPHGVLLRVMGPLLLLLLLALLLLLLPPLPPLQHV
jgi:hypothetical protein